MMRQSITRKTVWLALAGMLLAAPLAFAAQERGRRGRGMHGGGRDGHGGGPGALMRELDLTEEQQEQLRAVFEQGTARETFERLRSSREALNDAIDNGADEATLRQLAYEVGTAEGDVAVERARTQAAMLEILTPEQREKWETLKAERKEEREARRKRFEERRARHRDRKPEGP